MSRGVGVREAVEVGGGSAVIVWLDAASAVCTMNVPIALGSSGGMGVGVAKDGTHPIINDRIVKQVNSFVPVSAMFPLMFVL